MLSEFWWDTHWISVALWYLSSVFRVDQWKYLESILKKKTLPCYCWILLPPIYYKSLLQPVTQTEGLSRPPAAWTGSKMKPFWHRHTIFKEDASETSEITVVLDSAIFHNSRTAREVFGCWDWDKKQCFFTWRVITATTHHPSITQRGQKIVPNRDR